MSDLKAIVDEMMTHTHKSHGGFQRCKRNFAERLAKAGYTSADGWISVNDKLPEQLPNNPNSFGESQSIEVDVFGDGERWPNCHYDYNDEIWIDPDIDGKVSITVTHWMKKPQTPTK